MNNFLKSLVEISDGVAVNEKLSIYEPLVGEWDFEWVGLGPNGEEWRVAGEWFFSWILKGRAIQDNWICPSRHLKGKGGLPEGQLGTTIRFYDPTSDSIKIFWLGTNSAQCYIFTAQQEGNQIVQNEITMPDGKFRRWIISSITTNSFTWEAFESMDGQDWMLVQQVFATRRLH